MSPHIEHALQVERVCKRYGATRALDDVSFTVTRGSSHALVGRNGAGKSTLIGVVTGLVTPDSGTVRINADSSRDKVGAPPVACVFQHPQTLPHLTVAENLAIGVDRSRVVSWSTRRRHASEILEEWKVPVRPDDLAGALTIEQRQLLEIARALSRGSEIVLLDEPTSQLDRQASERLFEHIRELQQRGITFLFISHHLDEVIDTCNTATVLRDGRVVTTRATKSLTQNALVDLMVGGNQDAAPEQTAQPAADGLTRGDESWVVLDVQGLTSSNVFRDVNIQVRSGEIVAVTGLAGSGKVSLAESIVGLRAREGQVTVNGVVVRPREVGAGQRAGLGFLPGDRHKEGFVANVSVAENLTMAVMPQLSRRGRIDRRQRAQVVGKLIRELDITPADPNRPVGELSGGNQQKVVMGRALASSPRCLVVVAPTAGVDVASKAALYRRIRAAAADGAGVLLVSDELDELALASRAYVMFAGKITAQFEAPWKTRDLIAAIEGVTRETSPRSPGTLNERPVA